MPDTANRSTPAAVLVLFPEAIVSIAAGQGFSAAVSLSGRVYTWGRGKYGALGSGRVEDRATPCPVPGIADAIQVSLWHAPVHDLELSARQRKHKMSRQVLISGRGKHDVAGSGRLEDCAMP
jgi:alpha-tubulin suppressor-like RCC1 family protein